MRIIKTWRDPYGEGFTPCKPKEVEIQSGVTVLVGCNGSGKTTMLKNIKEILGESHTPYVYHDNLHDGGSYSAGDFLNENMLSVAATLWTASEGECININLSVVCSKLKKFITDGEYIKDQRSYRLQRIFRDEDEIEKELEYKKACKERWILLDAIDSGLSIDNVVDLKNLFKIILEESEEAGIETYIVVSANEYELVDGSACLDVTTGKYIEFKDYSDFKKFILKSREKKDKRYKNNK